MVLVIPCNLFHNLAATIVLKDDEIAKQGEKSARVKNALQHDLQLGQSRGRQLFAGDGSPRLEPLAAVGQRADAGGDTVRDEQGLIGGKEDGQFRLVGLELVKADQTVASSSAAFLNSMMPSGRPLRKSTISGRRVFLFSVTVNWLTASQLFLAGFAKSMTRSRPPRTRPIPIRVLNLDAVNEHPVKGTVASFKSRSLQAYQLAIGVIDS